MSAMTQAEILAKLSEMATGAVFAACSICLGTIEIQRESKEAYAYQGHHWTAQDLSTILAREADLRYFGVSSRQ